MKVQKVVSKGFKTLKKTACDEGLEDLLDYSIALRTGVPILRKISGFEKSLSLKRAFKRRQIIKTLSVIHRWKTDTFFFKKKE